MRMNNREGIAMRIAVTGGMNLDLLGTPSGPLHARDSTPGHISVRPGGVGRNIAQRLRELGAEVFLITALGCDVRAEMLARFSAERGIDLSYSVRTDCPAPCYLCIHDERGDMLCAVNDMTAMERLTPGALAERMDFINSCDGCVADANLSEDSLVYLAEHVSVPLFMDPVSAVKAPRVLPILSYLTAIKPNALEALALTGEHDPVRAAEKLLSCGVRNVCITLGSEGAYYACQHSKGMVPVRRLTQLPQTGAGDAFCAGLTLALLSGRSLRESAQAGCDAAFSALARAEGR